MSTTCTACPRHCRLAPGRLGFCRARRNAEGAIVAANYGQEYDPETEISAGEEVGFTAQLSNLSDHDVVLSHGDPLIVLSLCSAEDEAEEGVGAVLAQTAMKAHEQIEKETFIRVEEAGDYRLRAYCAFSIGGEEYRYECEDIPIKVTDAQSAE